MGTSANGVPNPPYSWKRDESSVNAVSVGFLATAILISIFLVIAVAERFLSSWRSSGPASLIEPEAAANLGTQDSLKRDDELTEGRYRMDISVLMPGQVIPTFLANPAPIPPSSKVQEDGPS